LWISADGVTTNSFSGRSVKLANINYRELKPIYSPESAVLVYPRTCNIHIVTVLFHFVMAMVNGIAVQPTYEYTTYQTNTLNRTSKRVHVPCAV